MLDVKSDGSYTLTVTGAMTHPAGDGENNLYLTSVKLVGQDKDGDPVSVTFQGTVQDDIPVVKLGDDGNDVKLTALVEEESAPNGSGGVIGNQETETPTDLSYTATKSMTGAVSWGADGFGKVTAVQFGTTTVTVDAATSGKVYFNAAGEAQAGETGSAAVLDVKSDGSYTLTVTGAMTHPAGDGENNLYLTRVKLVGQDKDGDPVSVTFQGTVQDDIPIARNDVDSVGANHQATGNVITGAGTTDPATGADSVGADGAKVSGISGSGTEKDTNPLTAQGEHGSITIDTEGAYTYTANATSAVSPANLNFTTATKDAFDYGEAYTKELGETRVGSSGPAKVTAGFGVDNPTTSEPGDVSAAPEDQLGYSPSKGSEALSLDLGTMAVRAVVDISNLYQDESGKPSTAKQGETGRWEAFDDQGHKVGEGIIGGSLFQAGAGGGDPVHQGQVEIEVRGADGQPIAFQNLVFTAVDYGAGTKGGDSSDYFVKAVSVEKYDSTSTQDVFNYTLTDGDGDTAQATLTINGGQARSGTGLGTVQEDGLLVGNLDAGSANNTVTSGTLGIGMGVDIAYSLLAPVQKITSGGTPVTFTVSADGATMTGKAGDRDVMTVSIDKTTGEYAVNLTGQVDHTYKVDTSGEATGAGAGEQENLYLQLVAQKVTATGTEVQGFNIKIQDDAPVYFGDKQDTLVANDATVGPVAANLGVRVGADLIGADVNLSVPHVPVSETGPSYVYLTYNTAAGPQSSSIMTVDGHQVYYKPTTDGNIAAAYTDGAGAVHDAFTIKGVVNADGAAGYEVNMKVVIDPIVQAVTFTADEISSALSSPAKLTYTDTVSGLKLEITADKDADLTTPAFTSTSASETVVATSTDGAVTAIGVDDGKIDNAALDGAGERLTVAVTDTHGLAVNVDSVSFTPSTAGAAVATAVADAHELPTTATALDGTGTGTGTGTLTVTAEQSFDHVQLQAAEGTSYSVAPTVSVGIKVDQVWIDFQASVVDGDGDTLANAVAFKVVIDTNHTLNGDTVTLSAGSTGLVIAGGSADEVILGSPHNDIILGSKGNDTIDGRDGVDTLSYANQSAAVTVELKDADATTPGTATGAGIGTDTIVHVENVIGGAGDDKITGNSADNVLSGGAGNDTLIGGAGNDTLIGGAGSNTLIGGAGIDTASYAAEKADVTATLTDAAPGSTESGGTVTHGGASPASGTDTLVSIENVTGGAGDDKLTGNSSDNVLSGGAGNDTLVGGAGNDTLIGGSGSDTLTGGLGHDVIQINLADNLSTSGEKDVVTDLAKGDVIVAHDLLPPDGGDISALLPAAADSGNTAVTVDSNGAVTGGTTQSVVVEHATPDQLLVDMTLTGSVTIEIKPTDPNHV